MGINYRKVDPQAIGYDVMKQRALESEQRAFGNEIELDHLNALVDKDLADANVADQLRAGERTAARTRRIAERAAGAAPITALERLDAQRKYLDGFLDQIERQHASAKALKGECERQLGLSGDDVIEEQDERDELEEGLRLNERSIRQLEVRHGLILEHLKRLDEEEDQLSSVELPEDEGEPQELDVS